MEKIRTLEEATKFIKRLSTKLESAKKENDRLREMLTNSDSSFKKVSRYNQRLEQELKDLKLSIPKKQ